MRTLLLATVAVFGLATAGIAEAAGTGCDKLAANGMPVPNTATESQLAASGQPIPNTAERSQLAASGKPELSTDTKSQLAASGQPIPNTAERSQRAAGGGQYPGAKQLASTDPNCRE
jgi:hypothetical protein